MGLPGVGDPGARGVGGVHQVLAGQKVQVGEVGVDLVEEGAVLDGGDGGGGMHDDLRQVRVAGLREMCAVPAPLGAVLDAVVRVGVVGGVEAQAGRGEFVAVAPAQRAGGIPVEVVRPHLPEDLDLAQAAQPGRGPGFPQRGQQSAPVVAEGLGERDDPGRAAGDLADFHAVPVALVPARFDQRSQPAGVLAGEFFQCCAHALADQLQAADAAYRGQDVGGVGALPPPRREEAGFHQASQHQVQDAFGGVPRDEAGAELAQHRVVEAGIVQGQAVKSARSAVPAFRPARFSGPLPAPAVRLSTQRALHKSRSGFRPMSHPVTGQGEGVTEPR
ncbi:hypothetical protein [Streptomyces sp. NPDC047009]|uniref:hypothetical protein n=1 Tax=Streptomyces sp. NPDC047009 TaxID=3154496 RepID=UPI0033C4956E